MSSSSVVMKKGGVNSANLFRTYKHISNGVKLVFFPSHMVGPNAYNGELILGGLPDYYSTCLSTTIWILLAFVQLSLQGPTPYIVIGPVHLFANFALMCSSMA